MESRFINLVSQVDSKEQKKTKDFFSKFPKDQDSNTLLNAFKEKISSKVIVGLWRRTLKNAKEYFESNENIQFINDEFDVYSNSDYNHVI
ncbi:hypothetical protein RhiirA4_458856 [Rhizophagus irregularis]|uniref:Uncharacterized protein n=1 Tax=Rhizophagus irregularis TaxID=588596 RepID=A0A2I1GD30_9GLOM|nr:hypothetical protein RhiirA4_458856 [Rhizophagus irregularis]